MLGVRQPEIYGYKSFESYLEELKAHFANIEITYQQTNHEGELVTAVQQSQAQGYAGLVINAAAYTHTSIALGDALAAVSIPKVEVHISNIFAREPFRHHSYLSAHCQAVVCGMGLLGYHFALSFLEGNEKNKEILG